MIARKLNITIPKNEVCIFMSKDLVKDFIKEIILYGTFYGVGTRVTVYNYFIGFHLVNIQECKDDDRFITIRILQYKDYEVKFRCCDYQNKHFYLYLYNDYQFLLPKDHCSIFHKMNNCIKMKITISKLKEIIKLLKSISLFQEFYYLELNMKKREKYFKVYTKHGLDGLVDYLCKHDEMAQYKVSALN